MARNRLKPLRQGGLDSLCGVYAIINAVQLVLEPAARLIREDQLALFAALIEELARKGELSDAVTDGLGARQEWRLARHATGYLRQEHDIALALDRPFRVKKPDSFDKVASAMDAGSRNGAAYIIEVREWKYHWTVVRGVTSKSLLFLDSAGVRLMRRSSGQLGYRKEEGKHMIAAASIVRVFRADGR